MITGIDSCPPADHSLSSVMPDIQQHEIRPQGLADLPRLRRVLGEFDGVTFVGEDLRQ
jgi:hypothetical protein